MDPKGDVSSVLRPRHLTGLPLVLAILGNFNLLHTCFIPLHRHWLLQNSLQMGQGSHDTLLLSCSAHIFSQRYLHGDTSIPIL